MSTWLIVVLAVLGYVVVGIFIQPPLADELYERSRHHIDADSVADTIAFLWPIALPLCILCWIAQSRGFKKGPTRAMRERRERKESELRLREERVKRLERELDLEGVQK